MTMSRRSFIKHAGAAAGATLVESSGSPAFAARESPLSPAVNPRFLTGSREKWPLAELAAMGYRGLELIPDDLENAARWQPEAEKAGLKPICVNALPDLSPYLTGSLSDAVDYRRKDTVAHLAKTLEKMRGLEIPFLVVCPSRLAENYQSAVQARGLLVESLRTLAKVGPTILLTAAPFRLFASSQEIKGIVDNVGGANVAAALDVGAALLNGDSPGDAAKTLGARLRYVQVRDVDLRPGVPRLNRYLPVGDGSAKREDVRAALGARPVAVTVAAPSKPVEAARAALEWVG